MAQNLLGIRVVRGPDWPSAGDVDGGAGGVGTVVEISNGWSAEHAGPSCVTVQWDTGKTGTYRCGGVGERDLRILDTTITGEAVFWWLLACMLETRLEHWFREASVKDKMKFTEMCICLQGKYRRDRCPVCKRRGAPSHIYNDVVKCL